MKVLLAGATGAIGRQLLPLLRKAGHSVIAMTRFPSYVEMLQSQGAKPLVCDVFDQERLLQSLENDHIDAIIHQLTSIPGRMNPKNLKEEMAPTNRLRDEGTRILLEVARRTGAHRFLVQSIAFAYHPGGNGAASEEEPLYMNAPEPYKATVGAINLCEEQVLKETGLEHVILRYGFFYGPGTIYDRNGSFYEDVMKRQLPVLGRGNGYLSFIHVRDAAAATLAALQENKTGVFNIVDDTPVTVGEWLPHYARKIGAPRPYKIPRLLGRLLAGAYVDYIMNHQRGASNAKARRQLRWTPLYSTWSEGFTSEFSNRVL